MLGILANHPDDTARRAIRQIFLFTSVVGAVVIGRSKNLFVTYLQTTSLLLLIYESLFFLMPWISFDVYGNFTGAEDADLAHEGLVKYASTEDGLVPWRERPIHFRKNCIARIPPLRLPE